MPETRGRTRVGAVVGTVCLATAVPQSGWCASAESPGAPATRLKIGLVLAGGGAKGGAHVGVLKVLEEQHVKIDCIAGTSMGALVGAGYAAGMPAAELDKFLRGIDWDDVVGGVGRRPLEPIEQKRLEIAAEHEFELGVKDGAASSRPAASPTPAASTTCCAPTWRRRARWPTSTSCRFRTGPSRPTWCPARWSCSIDGDLATAMRASMAIPGAFAPVIWDKYILADGGQVRNIPVDVARETCADVVIVVNLVEPPTPPEKLVQAQQLLARSMEVMLEANENLSLASLGPETCASTCRWATSVPRTSRASRRLSRWAKRPHARSSTGWRAYAVPEAEYVAWRNRVTTPQDIETRLAGVRFEGLQYVNPEFLAHDDPGRRQRRHRRRSVPTRCVCRRCRTSTPCRTGWRAIRPVRPWYGCRSRPPLAPTCCGPPRAVCERGAAT